MTTTKNYLLGCDWGTSTFRLRLIDTQNQQVLGEITSQEGVASTFKNWQAEGEPNGIVREPFFRQQLRQQISRLGVALGLSLNGVGVVISGMASSSIGMADVPYATLPFPLDGSRASVRFLEEHPDFPHDSLLIGGVSSAHDVMRGEETQLIGIMTLLSERQYAGEKAILLFPGTHSKHIYIHNQQVADFQTFMTGEVFSLMAHHSILKDSVETGQTDALKEAGRDAFRTGVREAGVTAVLNSLFRVRTNQLFGMMSKAENALYLSGLLIGSELHTLTCTHNEPLILCCGTTLNELYTLAMHELGLADRTLSLSADLLDKATIAGQIKLMQHQLVTTR